MRNRAAELLASLSTDANQSIVSIDAKDVKELFDLKREVETKVWQCNNLSLPKFLQHVSKEIKKLAISIGAKPVVLLSITTNNRVMYRDLLQFIESTQERTTRLMWGLCSAQEGDNCRVSALVQPAFVADPTLDEDYKWCENDAHEGDDVAQCRFGDMYYFGNNVEQSYSKALGWYLAAAKQGNMNAQYNVGVMYCNGEGVEQDIEEALRWFVKAEKRGYNAAEQIAECQTILSK